MTPARRVRVAIVGCGFIAGAYAEGLSSYPEVELFGVADIDCARAEAFAARFGCKPFSSLAELLEADSIEVVVNLTIFDAHFDVTLQSLKAGKHVYSEKPLAHSHPEAERLVIEAKQRGLRLGCAPSVLLGEAQQTAWRVLRDGRLGTVRVVYAEANHGRPETWHPAPIPFYRVGALFDVGVYPLTLATAMLGPVRSVQATARMLQPDRRTTDGTPFELATPDWVLATLELEDGAVMRLTTNFYVSSHSSQTGLEFHGDEGSLHLVDWQRFDSKVEYAKFGQEYAPIRPLQKPYPGTEWCRGLADLARALIEDTPHRATGEHAAHVVEILAGITDSITLAKPVSIHSSFDPPSPVSTAREEPGHVPQRGAR